MIGQRVTMTVDRPMGSAHPEHPGLIYLVNYGYVPGVMAPDGEEQDAYLLGLDAPVTEFTGRVIAIVHRLNDAEDKWVVAPDGRCFTRDEIRRQVSFVEQYFQTEIETAEE